jgi:molecular chaperone GrpE
MKKKTHDEGKSELAELKTKYLRVLADYQNLERRAREEKDQVRTFAAEMILTRLLPVLDTLGKAQDHLRDAGLDLAVRELWAVVEEQGVEKLETVGKPFNPHEMECIEVVDGAQNEVVEETIPGYTFRGKVLRVAQVKVGKKNEQSTNEKSAN